VGDTITSIKNPVTEPLEGFKPVQPRVFAGLFPISGEDYEKFRDALAKLRLNEACGFDTLRRKHTNFIHQMLMAIRENFNLIFWLNLAIHNANKRDNP
jgi:hypothetical protein